MGFSFTITDNTRLRYNKPWSPSFPYCNRCGMITANRGGCCTACLDSSYWDLDRTTKLTTVITEDWEIDEDVY